MHNEKERVVEHAKIGQYSAGIMSKTTDYCGRIFKRFMKDGSVLELGPAEGVMTDILYPSFPDYTVVDGADFFVESIKKRYPNIKGEVSLFEEYQPDKKYDNIVLGHVLEHVENPVDTLNQCGTWLAEGGYILAAVPNSHSIHRQAAVRMGLLDAENQLNETDKRNGHRRVYDMTTLQNDFNEAGLQIVKAGGYWLKPESNGQIEANWNENMVDAFLQLGEDYPDIAGEIYVVASL